jgi:hypothetical protein
MFSEQDRRPPFSTLIDAGFPGRNSVKETLLSHNEYIIRSNPGNEPYNFDLVRKHRDEHQFLRENYGIEIPDLGIAYADGVYGSGIYWVVRRVNGESLDKAFEHPSKDLIDRYQKTTGQLAHYLIDKLQSGKPYLGDIYSLGNFVYGTVGEDSESRIYMVDLDAQNLTNFLWFDGTPAYGFWLSKVAYLIQSVVEAERLGGVELQESMNFLSLALDNAQSFPLSHLPLPFLRDVIERKKNIDDLDFEEFFD